MILAEIVPWLVGAVFALLAFVGIKAKSAGKTEAKRDIETKVNKQAAEAAKVVQDVKRESISSNPANANTRLRDDGWLRD